MLKSFFPDRDHKALLFDFDGTVADTMGAHLKAWNIGLASYNLTLSKEQHQAWAGRPTRKIVEMLNEMHKVQIPADVFLKEKEVHYFSAINEIKEIKAVMDVIKHYHRRLPMAIVTGSRRHPVETTLKHLGITQYFEHLICAEDYQNGKPAPDCFLLGAEKLGIDPAECLVFEDAHLGIEAARNAQMDCLKVDEFQNLVLVKY
ncbi:phosphatase [Bdellovibrio bacteriovorus]|uniref:Phosphatase n=1 Tax=Bdellovibrio bacteriovorus TaxID=959 RepID=A0A162GQU9_BDEBC|nr:HAD family phosphatase [Bdellovibrio bacteriovorus]KYG68730.1 phosphatase [Bdellovibrio bacteriovorus]